MNDWGTGSWLRRRVRSRAEAVAYSFRGQNWTYQQARDRAARLARALASLGAGRGDRVAYLGPNHPALLETLFATAQLGAVFVPVNFRLSARELAFVLADADCSVLVAAPGYEDAIASCGADLRGRAVVGLGDKTGGYEHMLARQPAIEPDQPVSLDEVALLLYTSGTTGHPKGAMLTHGNVAWNAYNVLLDMDVRPDEVAVVVTPMFHTAALNMVCLPVLLRGGRLLIYDRFEPDVLLRAITDERVTLMFGVPATYDRLAECPGWPSADLSSIRTLLVGGAPVPESTIRRYLDRDLRFVQGYGMTETSPGALMLDEGHVVSKAGSAGVPMFFTDVRVVGPDGRRAATGEIGEVVVQGPNVFAGYRGRPAETAEVLGPDGWFHSGDLALVDEDGYAWVTDRIKDVIISGGENIYPAEVENVLKEFPGVRECAVIGEPDDRWGEVARAVVVPEPEAVIDPDRAIAFLRERIAHYKVPRSVTVAAELPRTGSGKISKLELRERYARPAPGQRPR